MTTFLSSNNISLYTVPAAWWLCMVPHVYAFMQYDRTIDTSSTTNSGNQASVAGTGSSWKFNPTEPRTFLQRLRDNPHPSLTPTVKARLSRAEAASLNGYENLGFFAASVVAANISLIVVHANEGGSSYGKELWYVNIHSIGYLVSRLLFNWTYVLGVSGPARGLWFYTGLACATSLFVHAGNALRKLVK